MIGRWRPENTWPLPATSVDAPVEKTPSEASVRAAAALLDRESRQAPPAAPPSNSRALRRRIASVVAIALEGHLASLDIPSLGEIERWVSVTGNAKFLADQIAYMAELNIGEERVAQR